MALKTDYKDDVFSGDRKYQEKDNSDGTISLVDKTAYSQKGDTFSAADINAINKAVNELSAVATTATWDNVTGKPDAYPTTWENVTGKPEATTSTAGLMSAEDKTVLDGLKTHSHGLVNQKIGIGELNKSGDTWEETIGDSGTNVGPVLKVFWGRATAPEWLLNSNAPGIAFGSGDVRASISVDYADAPDKRRIRVAGCNGNNVNWYADLLHSKNYTDYVKSTTKSFTLIAANWYKYEDHWLYIISDSLITATSNQELIPDDNITPDQLKALQKANLIADYQASGEIHLRVFGSTPTIDIPIKIIFRGSI